MRSKETLSVGHQLEVNDSGLRGGTGSRQEKY